MASFSLSIRNWVEKTKDRQDLVTRKIGMDVLTRVVLRSPVDKGRFRANWQVSFDTPLRGTVKADDKNGAGTIAKGHAILQGAIAGRDIWIVNNLPYAIPLEYGWSKQAPAGMVRITVREFRAIVNKAAAEAKRERA
jgi:hypothetical protein